MSYQDSTNRPPPGPNDPGGPAPQQAPPDPRAQAFDQTRGQVSQPNPILGLASLLGINSRIGAASGDPSGINFNSPFEGDGTYVGDDPQQVTPPNVPPMGRMPRQMFIPHSPNRGPGGWGDDHWPITAARLYPGVSPGPYMPSPMESYGIIGGAGRQLQQWGSPFVGQPAGQASNLAMQFAPFLDMISKGAFSKNFNAARLQSLRIQQEQMLLNSEMAVNHAKQELQQYGAIFKEYELGGIDADTARQRVRELAVGDPQLTEMLNTRDLYGVEQFLNWRDSKVLDLEAGNTQLRKSVGDNRELETEYGYGKDSAAATTARPLPGAPEVTQPPARAAAEGAATDVESNDTNIMKATGATKEVMQSAHALLSGEENPHSDPKKDPAIQARVHNAYAALDAQVKQVLRNKDMRSADKLAAIEKIDPELADKLRGLVEYRTDPTSIPVRASARERMLSMAVGLDPQFNQAKYKAANAFWQTDKKENQAITRSAAAIQAYRDVNIALARIPNGEDTVMMGNKLREFEAGTLSGDDPYYQLFAAERVFAVEMTAVAAGGGTPRVTLVQNLLKHMDTTQTARQIRSQLQPDMNAAFGWIKAYQSQWERDTGKKTLLPGMDAETYKDYHAIRRSNPHTGEMPADADPRWKALAPTTKANIDPLDQWKPLTAEQSRSLTPERLNALNDFVRANQHSNDPEVRKQVLQAAQTLRAAAMADEDPDIDLEESEQARTRNAPKR